MTHAPQRLQAFRQELDRLSLEAAVVSDPRHVYYLTGYRPLPLRPAYLVVETGGEARLVAPQGAQAPGLALAPYLGYSIHHLFPALPSSLEALSRARPAGSGPVGLELDAVGRAAAEAALGGRPAADIGPVLRQLRLRKWPDELALICRCAQLTDAGYQAAARALAEGGDEFEIYLATKTAVEAAAGEPVEFDGDFVSGERSLLRGGPPTRRRPQPGDTFILDLFPTYRGYWADTCRTLVLGLPTPGQQALAERVLEALAAGRDAIRPGLPAQELYQVVRQALGRQGDASSFDHHAGHAVGLWPHESPMIVPADATTLAEGMVITLEPGLYLPETGGVRFEDTYLVTAQGAQPLSRFPLRLAP